MATKRKRNQALRDFLMNSFDRDEFDEFLRLNGYAEIRSGVNRGVGDSKYFLDVLEAMQRWGHIDAAFFDLLEEERPAKGVEIEGLRSTCLPEDRVGVGPSGGATTTTPPPAQARPAARLDTVGRVCVILFVLGVGGMVVAKLLGG